MMRRKSTKKRRTQELIVAISTKRSCQLFQEKNIGALTAAVFISIKIFGSWDLSWREFFQLKITSWFDQPI
ncbi:conserved hypothetical protein [Ricinus communis]|uniref:Uncharacterized protein n=1 Tax=Ricinus communis TaxID=3988 RepID=B9RLJ6_RICCO|nr:conserved hypothetical protein [Ricinus communis]